MKSEIDFNDFKKDPHQRIDAIEQEISFLKTVIKTLIKTLEKTNTYKKESCIYHKSLKSSIIELYRNDYFSESRSLRDVYEKLKDLNYDISAFSHTLYDLTFHDKKLNRLGTERKYKYINHEPTERRGC